MTAQAGSRYQSPEMAPAQSRILAAWCGFLAQYPMAFLPRSARNRYEKLRNIIKGGVVMRCMISTATAVIAVGAILTTANAADLYTTPPPAAEAPPPPVSEAPPTVGVAPPAVVVVPERRVVVVPERRVIVESGCPTVWRCGYWGCGWRASCAPVTADVYGVAPYWRHRIPYGYGESYRPNWGHSHPRWGHWRHGEG